MLRISILLSRLWLVVMVIAVPARAHAHLMNTGFGPFYDGVAHLFVTPEDLLPAVALVLLAGLRGPRCGRAVLFVLPVTWLLASIAGRFATTPVTPPVAVAGVTIAFGALVAADMRLPMAAVAGLAAVLGSLHGWGNGMELARVSTSVLANVGIVCALFALVALLAGQVTTMRRHSARIAVRVAGSWVAAIGLFMLGWSVRGG